MFSRLKSGTRKGDSQRALHVVGDLITPRLTASETAGRYEMFEVVGPEGSGPPLHSHPWNEAYLVIAGELDVRVGPDTSRLKPGDTAFIAPRSKHGYRIVSREARFIVATTPARAAAFFTDLDADVKEMPRDLDAFLRVVAKHGAKVHEPPTP